MTRERRSSGRASEFADAAVPQRLQKWLAAAGIASRRGSEQFLREGRVAVNGKPARLGDSADPSRDVVTLDGEALNPQAYCYWILHKPRGTVTTARDPEGRPTVLDLLPKGLPRVFPVGRLDRETSGLILLTNDGDLAHRLLHPSRGNTREYRVAVRGEIGVEKLQRLESGIRIGRERTASAQVSGRRYDAERDATRFRLVLREGKKRQIRRSLEILGHPVKRLVRSAIGPLLLQGLPVGRCRVLSAAEIQRLRAHVEELDSASSPSASPRVRKRRRSARR